MDKTFDQVTAALRDCVSVMERDLNGLAVIQPELQKAREALACVLEPGLAWNGEGLPPVGTVCEANMPPSGLRKEYAWKRVKVVHGGLPDSTCEVLVYDIESTQPAWVDEFRQLRTPEQIAAEERDQECNKIYGILASVAREGNRSDMAEALYDAGYRKITE